MSATARFVDGGSGSRLWLLLFCVVGLVYALTATYNPHQANDSLNTGVQAHQIATTGSPALDGLDPSYDWLARQLREGPHGQVTDRHPGSVLVGVVAYTLARPLLPRGEDVQEFVDVPVWPASLAAALLSAAAVATLGLALARQKVFRPDLLVAVCLVLAFGTSTWPVSANALWPHSLTQFGIALGVLGLVDARPIRTGIGFALAIVARTHTAIIAAAAGLSLGLERRRAGPVAIIGAVSTLGLVAAMAYGVWVFGGSPSPTVGRGEVTDRLVHAGGGDTFLAAVGNQLLLFVHPLRGVFAMTPVLLPLVPALPEAWRRAPFWVRGLALGGFAQLVVQGLINTYAGGAGFFGSRVTLEFLTASVPLWALAYAAVRERPLLRTATHVLAVLSIVLHGLGATVWKTGVSIPWLS